MNRINYNRINNELSQQLIDHGLVGQLLATLGSRRHRGAYSDDATRFRGSCPVHDGDPGNFELKLYGRELPLYWQCFSHGCHKTFKPSLLGLVRGAISDDPERPVGMATTVEYVRTYLARHPTPVRSRPTAPQPAPVESVTLSLSREQARARLTIPCPYFLNRGYSDTILDRYDIGWSRKLNRPVAPVYGDDGRCVGFLSRFPDRWDVWNEFRKSDYLYGDWFARQSRVPKVLLVEGVPDVLRAAEAGLSAVACFGVSASTHQLARLAKLCRPVVIAFDNDKAGHDGAVSTLRELKKSYIVASIRHPPESVNDVGDMDAGSVAEWWSSALRAG